MLIYPEFNIKPHFTDTAFLRIDINDMVAALPKQLTKRKILNPNSQREIQETISANTLDLLQAQLSELRQALISYVSTLTKEAEDTFNHLENDIQQQIDDLLSFTMDETLIEQLKSVNSKLKVLLK